jgi:hypothetical protein
MGLDQSGGFVRLMVESPAGEYDRFHGFDLHAKTSLFVGTPASYEIRSRG